MYDTYHDYPSMSYAAFSNTELAVHQLRYLLFEEDYEMNDRDLHALKNIIRDIENIKVNFLEEDEESEDEDDE